MPRIVSEGLAVLKMNHSGCLCKCRRPSSVELVLAGNAALFNQLPGQERENHRDQCSCHEGGDSGGDGRESVIEPCGDRAAKRRMKHINPVTVLAEEPKKRVVEQ